MQALSPEDQESMRLQHPNTRIDQAANAVANMQ
jgi:hypothetical protein